ESVEAARNAPVAAMIDDAIAARAMIGAPRGRMAVRREAGSRDRPEPTGRIVTASGASGLSGNSRHRLPSHHPRMRSVRTRQCPLDNPRSISPRTIGWRTAPPRRAKASSDAGSAGVAVAVAGGANALMGSEA
ncbi:MAG: hypothetical protein KJZ68_12465, partial [Phycisphaerales bacterium]|nr:hypothetical protein [Phycisphaerales bacterium]